MKLRHQTCLIPPPFHRAPHQAHSLPTTLYMEFLCQLLVRHVDSKIVYSPKGVTKDPNEMIIYSFTYSFMQITMDRVPLM